MYFTKERGIIDIPEETRSVPIKGPLTKCIVPCSTIVTKEGLVKLVFGLPSSSIASLVNKHVLYCNSNTIVSNLGISRLFAGCECDAEKMSELKNEMILNQKIYKPINGDNLLDLPSEVLFVDKESKRLGI